MPDDQGTPSAPQRKTPPYTFTADDASKGGHARAAAIRARKQEAQEIANEQLREHLTEAVGTIVQSLYAEAENVRLAAAKELLDRVAGKIGEQVELTGEGGGPLVFQRTIVKPQDYEPTS